MDADKATNELDDSLYADHHSNSLVPLYSMCDTQLH